jgi:hypothetical protein
MANEFADWPRQYYEPGGGDAFLFHVVYGDFPPSTPPPLDAQTYRSAGIPPGLKLARFDRASRADWFAGWEQDYVWGKVCDDDPALADAVRCAPDALLLHGEVADPPNLNYLRDAIGLLAFLLDHGGVGVHDAQVFHFFAVPEWRARIFDPAAAVPRHHVVILTSDEPADPRLTWFHTRGLRKFGRPDLSLHNVGPRYRQGVIDLFERFIEFQAFGGIIPGGREIRMRSLPPGGVAGEMSGCLGDPDFNNVHLPIAWPDEFALAE